MDQPAVSSGAARDDVEYQSQDRHPDGDCSDRQQDFGGRVRTFDGTGQGIEFAHGPIAKTKMTVVPRVVRVPTPGQPQQRVSDRRSRPFRINVFITPCSS